MNKEVCVIVNVETDERVTGKHLKLDVDLKLDIGGWTSQLVQRQGLQERSGQPERRGSHRHSTLSLTERGAEHVYMDAVALIGS